MSIQESFLGTGWGFPPEFSKPAKSVLMSSDEKDIRESLIILLSTRLGERIMVPDYGCNLEELLFQPIDLTLKTYITGLIKDAILFYEARISVDKIDIGDTSELEGTVIISIDYTIRATNSSFNIVYPFYRGEGAGI